MQLVSRVKSLTKLNILCPSSLRVMVLARVGEQAGGAGLGHSDAGGSTESPDRRASSWRSPWLSTDQRASFFERHSGTYDSVPVPPNAGRLDSGSRTNAMANATTILGRSMTQSASGSHTNAMANATAILGRSISGSAFDSHRSVGSNDGRVHDFQRHSASFNGNHFYPALPIPSSPPPPSLPLFGLSRGRPHF